MPGIWNVNKVYDINNSNRIDGKLSFAVGEAFVARLVKNDEKNSELLLKLLDGWQFSAKLEKALEFIPKGLIKFEVVGFEDGKLILKPVMPKEEKSEGELSSIGSALEEQNINMGKGEYELLQKMIKHNMPLTKENISKVKTLVDFKEKIASNPEEEEKFISKYLNSKGIEADSNRGKEITNRLKGFFTELKNISEADLLTLIENGIEVNKENIKSFNKVVKEQGTIYKDSQKIGEELNEAQKNESFSSEVLKDKTLGSKGTTLNIPNSEKAIDIKEIINKENLNMKNPVEKNNNAETIADKNVDNVDLHAKANENAGKTDLQAKVNENIGNSDLHAKANENKRPEEKPLMTENSEIQPKEIEGNEKRISQEKQAVDKNHMLLNDKDTAKLVKEQLGNKTAEIKDVLKNLLEDKLNLKPEVYSKVMQGVKESINDFKVFNSISNEYYYLDMPLKFKESEYGCKLMIKDERRKGKKVDSKNVKLVVSVNTGSMGMVDSYIKVVNNIMNIDIKCAEPWVKVLDAGKEKILKDVCNIGYSVSIDVSKRVQEANLVSCREFFEDSKIHSINTKV